MGLNSSQQEKLTSWLSSKGIQPQCAACASNNWATGDIISAPVMSAAGVKIGVPAVTMVQLICGNCGYVMLFAAVPIGLP